MVLTDSIQLGSIWFYLFLIDFYLVLGSSFCLLNFVLFSSVLCLVWICLCLLDSVLFSSSPFFSLFLF